MNEAGEGDENRKGNRELFSSYYGTIIEMNTHPTCELVLIENRSAFTVIISL